MANGWSSPCAANRSLSSPLDIAQHTFHNGPRALMQNLADRSSLLSAINKALDAGGSLDGTTLGPPSFFGLPAALYQPAASTDTP